MKLAAEEIFGEFVIRGSWWAPSDRQNAVFGTLFYSNDRIKLQLERAFIPELDTAYSFGDVKVPVVHGQANDGSQITVLRAFYSGSHGSEIDLVANEIVVGAHLDSTINVVRAAVVRFTNLEEWAGRSLVEQKTRDDGSIGFDVLKHTEPDLEVEGLTQFRKLTLTTSLQVSQTHVQTKLTNQSHFSLEFHDRVTLPDLAQSVRSIGNLLALLFDEPVMPSHIRLTLQVDPDGPETSANYAVPPRTAKPRKKSTFEMPFPLHDLEGQEVLEILFRNWFEKEKVLRPVYDLLLGTVYSPGQYVQSTFLSLAQALESFHRRVYGGHYVSPDEYSSLRKTLISAIPGGLDEKLAGKLKSMLDFGNELSLKSRLENLFSGIQAQHFVDLCGNNDARQFIKLLADVRNYLTHYSGKKPTILENTVEMYNLNRRIAALLTLLIFKYFGLPENAVFLPIKSQLRLF
jgi:hypothetical protein